jgi:hypothetical protein
MANIVSVSILRFLLDCERFLVNLIKEITTTCYDMAPADVNDFNLDAANVHMSTECNIHFYVLVRNYSLVFTYNSKQVTTNLL